MVRATSAANPPIARAQRTQPFDGALGLSPAPLSRSPEGAAIWQGSGGVPQIFFLLPLPLRKGAGGGVVRATSAANPPIARAQRTQPFDRALGLSPALLSRSPEGAAIWQGSGGVPQMFFLLSPFLLGRGPGGWSEPRARRTPQSRESRGRSPLTALWGCP